MVFVISLDFFRSIKESGISCAREIPLSFEFTFLLIRMTNKLFTTMI